jgi:hypothetical protein
MAGQEIPAPSKRMQPIDTARLMLTIQPLEEVSEEIIQNNPFNRIYEPVVAEEIVQKANAAPVNLISNRDILMGSLTAIRPTGSMQMSGVNFLLFSQKKLKVGDSISFVFNGQNYEVILSAIDNTTFTLRYKGEEITSPIKPAANKP